MEQVHFRGKVRVICKSAESVDRGLDEDTGQQTSAAIKNRDRREPDCDRKDDPADPCRCR